MRVREIGAAGTAAVWLVDKAGGVQRRAHLSPRISASARERLWSLFARVFLPDGFPHSVRPEYATYQLYDTLQALCSYLRGILTTTAILEASGVGNETASPLAAAVAWVRARARARHARAARRRRARRRRARGAAARRRCCATASGCLARSSSPSAWAAASMAA